MRILAPLDGSVDAEGILPILVDLARACSYELDLLRVVEQSDRVKEGRDYVDRRCRDLAGQGARATGRTALGDPIDEILREARAHDLVALSMLKRGPAAGVSAAVLRKSPVPMIVTRPESRGRDWRRIVVALDGCAEAEDILDAAGPIARAFHSTLHVIHIGLPILPFDDRKGVIPVLRERPDSYLEGVCDRLGAQGIPALPRKREGAPGPAICRYAEQVEAGLVCVASADCGSGSGVTESILRGAPCPVWISHRVATTRKSPEFGGLAGVPGLTS